MYYRAFCHRFVKLPMEEQERKYNEMMQSRQAVAQPDDDEF
jgi:hypothetical protein